MASACAARSNHTPGRVWMWGSGLWTGAHPSSVVSYLGIFCQITKQFRPWDWCCPMSSVSLMATRAELKTDIHDTRHNLLASQEIVWGAKVIALASASASALGWWRKTLTFVITFNSEELGLLYCTCVFHVTRPFIWYHDFYAPRSNDRGHIVFVLSVCLLSTLTFAITFEL